MIFRILYGCGLRVSEVVGLRYKDVNLEDGILTIREAKTDRDRYIPLSDSVKEACISYADKTWWEKDSDFFFPAPEKWIKEDADLTAMLPILSTYMGHKTVRSTAQYLRLTAEVYPDLMKKVEKSCAYVIPEVCHEGN